MSGNENPLGRIPQFRSIRLDLLQKELHVHRAVHIRGRCKVLLRQIAPICAPIQLGEAQVAVGDERAHSEFLGKRERVPVVAVSMLLGTAGGCDITEEPKGPRFVRALTAFPGKSEGLPGCLERVLEPAGNHVCFTEKPQEE